MVYGDFLNSDDQRVTHYRKILGILTLQTGALLLVAALSHRMGLIADLSENMLTTAVALFALIGSTTMMILFYEKRTTLPDAHLLLAAFILGIAFSVTSVTASNPFGDVGDCFTPHPATSMAVSNLLGDVGDCFKAIRWRW